MVSSTLPKNERWDNFQYNNCRIEYTIICFRYCLTFSNAKNDFTSKGLYPNCDLSRKRMVRQNPNLLIKPEHYSLFLFLWIWPKKNSNCKVWNFIYISLVGFSLAFFSYMRIYSHVFADALLQCKVGPKQIWSYIWKRSMKTF